MSLRVYDPTEISVIFAGISLQGFADGEFVKIEQETDSFADVVGTDGEVSRSKTSDKRATVTISLMQTSTSNDLLSAIATLDQIAPGGAGVGVLYIRDRLGRALFTSAEAWIAKVPDVSLDREPTKRDWKFRCAQLFRVDGGN